MDDVYRRNHRRLSLVVLSLLLLAGLAAVPAIIRARAETTVSPYTGLTALGMPASPQIFYPKTGYDVVVSERGDGALNQNLDGKLLSSNPVADHGPNCSAPAADALPNATNSHATTTTYDSVYVCHDHVMTSLNSVGYGEANIMPDALADWSNGQTVVMQWRVSTFVSTDRDWWDAWLTPYAEQLAAPTVDFGADLNGTPRDGIHVRLVGNGNAGNGNHELAGELLVNGHAITLRSSGTAQESKLTPSRSVRTLYQLEVSSTHIKLSLPEVGLTYIDQDISPLPFSSGVLQLAEDSYDPLKTDACGPPAAQRKIGGKCEPNTWHWSDISISNAQHFDISHPASRYMNPRHASNTFSAPAAAGSMLRFMMTGSNEQISFDDGKTYSALVPQPSSNKPNSCTVAQYLVPIPTGATGYTLKGANDCFGKSWFAKDASVLGRVTAASGGGSQPPTPTATSTSGGSPQPQNINNEPCMLVRQDGSMVNGHCTGTFTPDK
jgi:hypothetical protein